jgi:hypothetical protein
LLVGGDFLGPGGAPRPPTPGLWMLAGSAVLVCLVFFPQERFRIPIIDPVLTILAGAGLAARGAKYEPL